MKRGRRMAVGLGGKEPSVAARSKRDDDLSATRLVRSARVKSGELEDEPVNEEEALAISELRDQLPRPTAEEIAALAKKMARSG